MEHRESIISKAITLSSIILFLGFVLYALKEINPVYSYLLAIVVIIIGLILDNYMEY